MSEDGIKVTDRVADPAKFIGGEELKDLLDQDESAREDDDFVSLRDDPKFVELVS